MSVQDGPQCPGCGLPNYEGLCPHCRGDQNAYERELVPPFESSRTGDDPFVTEDLLSEALTPRKDGPRTESGRAMLRDPMYRFAIGHILAIEAEAAAGPRDERDTLMTARLRDALVDMLRMWEGRRSIDPGITRQRATIVRRAREAVDAALASSDTP